jgi:hypothetical protein
MDQYNYLNKNNNIKDNKKGHKIAAALYLVSNHLSDIDPLKIALRSHAVTLSTVIHEDTIVATSAAVNDLLEVAMIAHLISEKNASIIILELRHYLASLTIESDSLHALFMPVFEQGNHQVNNGHKMSYISRPIKISNPAKIPIYNENKSKRQDTILSFIDERKSVGIKDIAALFLDTSEKTIQRELGALVASGKITKRGEKRWSVYMSV